MSFLQRRHDPPTGCSVSNVMERDIGTGVQGHMAWNRRGREEAALKRTGESAKQRKQREIR